MAHGLIGGMSEADFNLLLNTGMVETRAQITETFNSATRNAVTLIDGDTQGEGTEESFMAIPTSVSSTVAKRDLTSAAAKSYNASKFDQIKSFVFAGEVNNIGDSASALSRIKKLDQYARNLGAQIAKDQLIQAQDIFVSAFVGAIEESTNKHPAAGDLTFDDIVDASTVVGDQSSNLSTLMMDARTFNTYSKNRVAENIYNESGITVYGGTPGTYGYDVLVFDNQYFAKDAITTDKGWCLLVGAGAVELKVDTTVSIVSELNRDLDNIPLTTTGEYTIECMVNGMKYGGADNPAFSVMQDAASWTRVKQAKILPYVGIELSL